MGKEDLRGDREDSRVFQAIYCDEEDGNPVVWVTDDGEGRIVDSTTGQFLLGTSDTASRTEQPEARRLDLDYLAFSTLISRRTPDVD